MEEYLNWIKELFEWLQGPEEFRDNLSYGDAIGISRGLYSHYGIYANKDSVIHYSSETSDTSLDATIRETDLKGFTRGDDGLFKLSFPAIRRRPGRIPVFYPKTTAALFAPRDDFRDRVYRLYSPEETVSRALPPGRK